MAKRAASLAAVVLGIAALYWSDFRREFALPVGFASSSMLTALPSLAAIVCIAVGTLVAAVAMPALVLTHPLRPGAPTLAVLLRTPIDAQTGARQNVRASRIVERYWLGMAAVSALAWAGVISWLTLCPTVHPAYGVAVLATRRTDFASTSGTSAKPPEVTGAASCNHGLTYRRSLQKAPTTGEQVIVRNSQWRLRPLTTTE